MSVEVTTACIDGVLDETIKIVATRRYERFGCKVPTSLPGVPSEVLNPREAWYDPATNKLGKFFLVTSKFRLSWYDGLIRLWT